MITTKNDNFNKYNLSKSNKLSLLKNNGYKVPEFGMLKDVSLANYKLIVYKNEYEHGPNNLELIELDKQTDDWWTLNNNRFCVEFINARNINKYLRNTHIYIGSLLISIDFESDDWRGLVNNRIIKKDIIKDIDRPFPNLPYVTVEFVSDYAIDMCLSGCLEKYIKMGIFSENDILKELKDYSRQQ